jgi:hypothetical protein
MIDELYFWMYRGLKKGRHDKDPASDALLGVLFFIGINIIVIGGHLNNYTNFIVPKQIVIFIGILLGLIQILLGYFYLFRKKEQIFNRINNLSKKRLKKGKVVFITYVLISLLMFYITLIFFKKKTSISAG